MSTPFRTQDDRALVSALEARLAHARAGDAREARVFWRGVAKALLAMVLAAMGIVLAPVVLAGATLAGQWAWYTWAWIAFAIVGGLKTIVPGGLDRAKGTARPGRRNRIARVALLVVVVSCGGLFVSALLAPDWHGVVSKGASEI